MILSADTGIGVRGGVGYIWGFEEIMERKSGVCRTKKALYERKVDPIIQGSERGCSMGERGEVCKCLRRKENVEV